MVAAFWVLLVLGMYPYVGYPALALVVAAIRDRPVQKRAQELPIVTVVIAAYNEARHIVATIRNKLEQDYPPELLDVVVVSDGSEDGTDRLVSEICETTSRVTFLSQIPRQGKTAGLNMAIPDARGELVIFSDANSMYRPDAIRKLVENFSDPSVGYATGSMRYTNADGSLVGDGCTAFMRYENWLRSVETRLGSVVGVDGGVDAVRRKLYRPMRADQLPDFVLPLSVVEQGYRVVYEPEAVLAEEALGTATSEFRMRVRVSLRALWALKDMAHLLNPIRHPLFAFELISHKLLRYLSFVPLAVASVLNVLLAGQAPIYALALLAQLLFWLCALAAWWIPAAGRIALVRYCFYFALVNVASAIATGRFLRGKKQAVWQPRIG